METARAGATCEMTLSTSRFISILVSNVQMNTKLYLQICLHLYGTYRRSCSCLQILFGILLSWIFVETFAFYTKSGSRMSHWDEIEMQNQSFFNQIQLGPFRVFDSCLTNYFSLARRRCLQLRLFKNMYFIKFLSQITTRFNRCWLNIANYLQIVLAFTSN